MPEGGCQLTGNAEAYVRVVQTYPRKGDMGARRFGMRQFNEFDYISAHRNRHASCPASALFVLDAQVHGT